MRHLISEKYLLLGIAAIFSFNFEGDACRASFDVL